jgi:tyrosinase
VWEDAIRTECGWTEPTPCTHPPLRLHPLTNPTDWDWYLDTPSGGGSWLKSPLFDPVSGFGGNGVRTAAAASSASPSPSPPAQANPLADLISGLAGFGGRLRSAGCVADGPFKDEKLHIGPMGVMRPNNTRCLTRNLNAATAHSAASKDSFRAVLEGSKTFGDLRTQMEMPMRGGRGGSSNSSSSGGKAAGTGTGTRMAFGSLHTVGHGGVGGEMLDVFTSTNDPLFFLHHAGLDRVWAIWQELDTSARTYNVAPASAAANPMAALFGGPRGLGGAANLTLDTPIWMGFAAPDRPTRVLMDTQNRDGKGILCYKYEKDASEYLA